MHKIERFVFLDRGLGIEYRTSELFLKDCCQFQISNALASDFSEFKENVTNLISDLGSPSVTFCPFLPDLSNVKFANVDVLYDFDYV